jgi:hypothetical protein
MKKVFLMLAFAGLVGSVSASVKSTGDGDKDKKATKKETKTCCKDKTDGKACSGEKSGEKKACCKDKKAAEVKPTETK